MKLCRCVVGRDAPADRRWWPGSLIGALLLLGGGLASAEPAADPLVTHARVLTEQVQALYRSGAHQQSLAMAADFFKKHPPTACSRALGRALAELYRLAAGSQEKLGRAVKADVAFGQALVHDPDVAPPPGLEPAAQRRFASLGDLVRSRHRGTLVVDLPCVGGTMAVDGRAWSAKRRFDELTVGNHRLTARWPGGQVTVDAWVCQGQTTRVKVEPPGRVKLSGGGKDEVFSLRRPGAAEIKLGPDGVSPELTVGTYLLEAGCSSIPKEVTVAACTTVELARDELCPSDLGKKVTYSALVLGVTSMVTAAVLYGVSVPAGNEAHRRYMAEPSNTRQMGLYWDDVEAAQNRVTAGHVLMGVGAAASGAALYFLLTRYLKADEQPRPVGQPVLGVGPASIELKGVF